MLLLLLSWHLLSCCSKAVLKHSSHLLTKLSHTLEDLVKVGKGVSSVRHIIELLLLMGHLLLLLLLLMRHLLLRHLLMIHLSLLSLLTKARYWIGLLYSGITISSERYCHRLSVSVVGTVGTLHSLWSTHRWHFNVRHLLTRLVMRHLLTHHLRVRILHLWHLLIFILLRNLLLLRLLIHLVCLFIRFLLFQKVTLTIWASNRSEIIKINKLAEVVITSVTVIGFLGSSHWHFCYISFFLKSGWILFCRIFIMLRWN